MAAVDDRAVGRRRSVGLAPTRKRATSSIGFCVADRPMRSSAAPHSASSRSKRQRQMRAALVRRQRVDLVDDHRARRRQHPPPGLRRQAGCRATPAWSRGYAADAGAPGRARPPAYRRCAPRSGSPHRADRARATPPRCPPAAPPGCAGCRSTAPSAARRRPPASRPAGRPPAPAAPAHRSPPGRRPASCPIRSAPRSACAVRPGSPATPPPAPPSVRRSCGRTSRPPRDETRRLYSRPCAHLVGEGRPSKYSVGNARYFTHRMAIRLTKSS